MLTTKRLVGVALEVNLREYVTCMHLPSTNKDAHSGFENTEEPSTEIQGSDISGRTKRIYVLEKIKKTLATVRPEIQLEN